VVLVLPPTGDAVLVIRHVPLTDALPLLESPVDRVEMSLWEKWSREGILLAFIAEQDEEAVGFAIAESHPHVVHGVKLAGTEAACRLLLERLVKLAGERDASVWCPLEEIGLRGMLEGWGFAPLYDDDFRGRPSCFYYQERNTGGAGPAEG
jgi:hypothetical protein